MLFRSLTIKCELNKLNRTGVNIVDNNLQDYKKTIYILNHELSEQNLLDKIRFGYFGTQAKYCDEKLAGQIILQWDKVKSELEITRKEVNHLIEAIQQLNK